MTKVAQRKIICAKCGVESEQLVVLSVNFMLGDMESNKKLMTHMQKCPNCKYEAIDISKDNENKNIT